MSLYAGSILLWYGAIVDIPAGYVLCDGNNGTPDLRDKFILGAGGAKNPGDTGGAAIHSHIFIGDGHTHDIGAGLQIAAGGAYDDETGTAYAAGTTNSSDGRPPFRALAYIMKT